MPNSFSQPGQQQAQRQHFLRLAELPRAGLEVASLAAAAPWLSLAPRGARHAVVVIPGFLADDTSTRVLREFVAQLGYDVYPWAQGRNLGAARMGGYQDLYDHIQQIYRDTEQKVSLIGWSLGGVHALAIADHGAFMVRQLVTLGSPLNRRDWDPADRPAHIPITSIYSRSDGVVPWQRSHLNAAPLRDNIEVHSSHVGLGFNPAVLYAVADRLALPDGEFEPFQRSGWRALTYPTP
jgi:pimeloyl-ACP methyl ester carboxylesterase